MDFKEVKKSCLCCGGKGYIIKIFRKCKNCGVLLENVTDHMNIRLLANGICRYICGKREIVDNGKDVEGT